MKYRAPLKNEWTDVVLVGGDHTEVSGVEMFK